MYRGMIGTAQRNGIASLIAAVMLGGCAANSDRYPSLAIRDFERVQGTFEVEGEAEEFDPPAPADQSSIRRASELVAEARIAHQDFIELAPLASEQLTATTSLGPDDNAWVDSQLTLADLDSKRSKVAILLGNLDLMFADASLSYQELAEIDEARETVRQLVSKEDEILSNLTNIGK